MKGSLWLAWRQQRALVLTGAALLLACVAWVAFQRADMMSFIDAHHFKVCKGWDSEECAGTDLEQAQRLLSDNDDGIVALGTLSAALPVIIGIFWGAPLLGRELESGTWKLALTQGVGLRRWFTARFGLAVLCSVLGSAVLAALVAWWWSPISNMLDGLYWHDGYIFNATGPAAVACALFGLTAGTAAGLLIRRTLPAMGVVLGVVVGLRFLLNTFRSSWIEPTARISQGDAPRENVRSAWSTGEFGFIDGAGRKRPIADACPWGEGLPDLKTCMAQKGFVGRYHKVYPSSDFWVFQWIETAIFLGLAAVLFALICVVLRRRAVI
ncbi:ABC transporter permease subunit [Streptomyces albireticuli]|uniref:Transporter n=1 Tax=Streptomyces albireticuli TaxID=1940 RepID=A0A2A2CXP9_9ACTN|nr:ABC transporter permease subunit [Streptomyces albireticuli]MCD9144431.1 ABC transporter permease subunit [Streptomyces albireticuli]MCD9163506.1 ABC transporter permease subunit [Streptomyces albireticuli]MCD9193108.1 ABC transporter permease subunit [Streptomyces albireticuli]PAU44051.1 transporter [Streptomyces albireticuli]